jgi:hypothetical protein
VRCTALRPRRVQVEHRAARPRAASAEARPHQTQSGPPTRSRSR